VVERSLWDRGVPGSSLSQAANFFEQEIKDDFYSKIPTKNFFYFLPICSLKYA